MNSGHTRESAGRRLSLVNEVAGKLIEMIRQGSWEPGSRIPNEFELAEQFGVGRGSVREAVKVLVSRNILEIRTAKGTYVCEKPGMPNDPLGLELLPNKEIVVRDMWEIRLLLECYHVRMAAARATEEQIAKMKELIIQIEKSDCTDEQRVTYDIELHRYIAKCSRNEAIWVLFSVINDYTEELCVVSDWEVANAEHRAVIAAIEQRNPMLAEAEITKHLSHFFDKMDFI